MYNVRVKGGVIHIAESFSSRALAVEKKNPEGGQVFLMRKDEITQT